MPELSPLLLWKAAVAILLCSCNSVALAHGALGDGTSFWSGALHVVTAPLAVAAWLGLCAFLSATAQPLPLAALGLAAIAALLCARFSQALTPLKDAAEVSLALPLTTLLIGLAATLALKPRIWLAWPLAAATGAVAGTAAGLDTPSWGASLGVALALSYWLVCGVVGLHKLRQLARIGPVAAFGCRVAGAWVAALGFLLLALGLRTVTV